jgi:hypothetical protein
MIAVMDRDEITEEVAARREHRWKITICSVGWWL